MRCVALFLSFLTTGCSLAADPAPTADPCPEGAVPTEYERRDWGRWTDADGDCQDTRQEVLIRDSSVEVTLDERGCRVVAGSWIDPYDGSEVTDPSKIDVDHFVALSDAHDSGGWQWSSEEKRLFANDLANLKATSQSTNRSKGERGPDEWLPALESARCSYITEWNAMKESYMLASSAEESARVTYMLTICSREQAPPLPQG